ncbi:TonB-dependent receptor [Sphingomonas piscis]|uniref:TonB-dependent receptor n=1 Tax=Sphingomonas piscis TaxID=2714943 RepID=A0A6G7YNW6_9SPHN|nr:TonB-dependent receptor [Sphingomonas piscis]QIK78432.1 TonB-dependent receptor [Sphingomonas piscis]
MLRLSTRAHITGAVSPFALGVALIVGAAPAHAQDTAQETATSVGPSTDGTPSDAAGVEAAPPVTEGADLVVTGIRASLAQSERIKKNNAVIVEAISAEDIGKLPDVSIADSLARLPGVTAQRLEGRDQRLSIRGLGPDFGTTLLNGREQVTVGDNRGVEYDQYPSEFFRNVIVYKSANAGVVPAGISGTVDLRMLRPLKEKPTLAVQLRGQLNSQDKLNPEGKRVGHRASATWVQQFAQDTVGVALGFSTTRSPTQNERYNSWGFPAEATVGGNFIIGGAKPYVQSSILDRTGVVGTIEVQPNDRLHITLDGLYSKFKETQYLRGIEFPIAPAWGSAATIAPGYTVEDGLVTDATVSGVVGVVRNDFNRRKANNYSLGANVVYALTEGLNLTVDGSWSNTERTDFLLENYSGTGYNLSGARDTLNISLGDDNRYQIVPTLSYTNPANFVLTDPRGWGYNGTATVVQSGFLNRPDFQDDLKALRTSLDGQIGGGFLSKWEVGAIFSRRSKDSRYKSYFLCPKDPNPSCTLTSGQALSAPIPSEAVNGTVPLDYLGVPGMLALDPLYLYRNSYDREFDNRPDSLARDYNVTEKVLTGYAALTIDTELGAMPLGGTVGVQVVRTNQSSSGRLANLATIGGVPTVTLTDAEQSHRYTDVLPSLALSLEATEGLFIKAGASKTMVRPRMDQERITQNVSIDFSRLSGTTAANSAFSSTGGNPALEPYRSRNLDLSIENYFRKGGYLALTAFRKKLTDFVDPNNAAVYDFADLAANLPAVIRAQIGTTQGRLGFPANTGRGYIRGQELSLSMPFANFSSVLDGFGIFSSVSRVKSRVRFANSPDAITIPGLSKWVGTAEGYYEKNGFQARVSYRYRSKFLAEIAGLSANPEFRTARPEGILDAQIGYEFQPGSALEGLSILAQGKNLTDRPFVTYELGDSRFVRDYQRYGRDFYLGIAYKF